ncbi:MAG: PQQ-binding-like beta-propeller repeat protein [Prolixibacteraceae bacterium]
MRIFILLFAFACLAFAGCTPKNKVEWVKWRGPTINNVSPDKSLDPAQLDSSSVIWRSDVGFGHSSVSVKGKYCYTCGWKETFAENDTSRLLSIVCMDIETGRAVWETKYPAEKNRFPGPRSTPVIDDNRLYSINWDGKMVCLNIKNGEELWSLNLATDSLAVWDNWGFNPSPVVHNDLILLNLNQTGLALNKYSGEVLWTGPYGISSWASAYLAEVEEKICALFQADTSIFIVDVETGAVQFSYRKKSDGAINNAIVRLSDNRIYTSDEMLVLNGNQLEPVWYNDSIASFFRTGVIVGDYSYQFSDAKGKNFLYCVDLRTGAPVWRQDMLGRWGNLMAVGNHLVILETFGKVLIVNASPAKYELLKDLQVLSDDPKQDNFCWVAPTFVNGKLFVRNSKGELACIQL